MIRLTTEIDTPEDEARLRQLLPKLNSRVAPPDSNEKEPLIAIMNRIAARGGAVDSRPVCLAARDSQLGSRFRRS